MKKPIPIHEPLEFDSAYVKKHADDNINHYLRLALVIPSTDHVNKEICYKQVSDSVLDLAVREEFGGFYLAGKYYLQLQHKDSQLLRADIEDLIDHHEGWPFAHLLHLHIATTIDKCLSYAIFSAARGLHQCLEESVHDEEIFTYANLLADKHKDKCQELISVLQDFKIEK